VHRLPAYARVQLSGLQTPVNIASMSKAFTAAAVALLIADFAHGRNATPLPAGVAELSWRTKVKDVLPELRLYDRCASEHVSIQDMLAHLTGVSGFV
jgi:CubicO group peptidase (beta-lactamase class C family)